VFLERGFYKELVGDVDSTLPVEKLDSAEGYLKPR